MDIKRFRHDLRLSQSDLANLFDCNASNVSNIERGARSLTALQIRLLIEKYGFDTISKYADPSELPSVPNTVNVDMSRSSNITGNTGNVQNGDGNSIGADATLIQVMKQQSDQITRLLEQQERLITLLENK